MTERDYINATNLAKIRICKDILRNLLPQSLEQEAWEKAAVVALRAWEAKLEKAVSP